MLLLCFCCFLLPQMILSRIASSVTLSATEQAHIENTLAAWKPDSTIKQKARLRFFNPNEAAVDTLMALGIPKNIAARIVKYREKGGRFYRPEDIRKIYGLDSTLAEVLIPFIKIPPRAAPKADAKKRSPKAQKPKKESYKIIDINEASAEEWRQFRGIGPAISARIIKFRDALGGFYEVDQVNKTYGLKDSLFQVIRPFLACKPAQKKININKCSLKELASHPYIDWKKAKTIIRYREQHGPFPDLEAIISIKVIDDELLDQIKPYLTL